MCSSPPPSSPWIAMANSSYRHHSTGYQNRCIGRSETKHSSCSKIWRFTCSLICESFSRAQNGPSHRRVHSVDECRGFHHRMHNNSLGSSLELTVTGGWYQPRTRSPSESASGPRDAWSPQTTVDRTDLTERFSESAHEVLAQARCN